MQKIIGRPTVKPSDKPSLPMSLPTSHGQEPLCRTRMCTTAHDHTRTGRGCNHAGPSVGCEKLSAPAACFTGSAAANVADGLVVSPSVPARIVAAAASALSRGSIDLAEGSIDSAADDVTLPGTGTDVPPIGVGAVTMGSRASAAAPAVAPPRNVCLMCAAWRALSSRANWRSVCRRSSW